jgi:hypothetical protein
MAPARDARVVIAGKDMSIRHCNFCNCLVRDPLFGVPQTAACVRGARRGGGARFDRQSGEDPALRR